MTVQEAVKKAIKSAGLTQADVAERCGFSGQGAVSMYLRSKSMRVESLAMMLKACGYDLVARSKSPGVRYPEIVIEAEGDVTVPDCEAVQQEMVMGADEEVDEKTDTDVSMLEALIRRVVREEMVKATPGQG